MFSGQSPKRTNIEEANKHLQLLYTRVTELEKQLQQQQQHFDSQNQQVQERVQQLALSKDAEISDLKLKLDHAESQIMSASAIIKDKECIISSLELKAKRYDEIAGYTPMLTSLLALCSAPAPHTQTGSGLSNGSISGLIQNQELHVTNSTHPGDRINNTAAADGPLGQAKRYAKPHLDTSPSIQQMARRFSNNRHFSISEDELDDGLPGDVFSKIKTDKECYL